MGWVQQKKNILNAKARRRRGVGTRREETDLAFIGAGVFLRGGAM